jgi:(p)ppGpp synthase/HD superfamily hydrolase
MSVDNISIITLALKIATKAHSGQYRWDNKTQYIEHPKSVANRLMPWFPRHDTDFLMSVALLHDVLEDTKLTAKDLIRKGIPLKIVDVVKILTKVDGQCYLDYLLKVKENENARLVKIEDIRDNLSTIDKYKNKKHLKDKYLLSLYILGGRSNV